jgi:TolB protein
VIRYALLLALAVALGLASAVGAVTLRPAGDAAKPTQGRANIDPVWSPDGTRIAFVSTADVTRDHDVWVMRADGTRLFNLTSDPVNEGSPAWSPDGTRLAFTSEPNGSSGALSVEIIDAGGDGRRVLAAGRFPAWSPDGGRIAYAGEGGVHVLEVAGGVDRLVAPAASDNPHRPSWSPDGRRIAYVRDNDLWVVDAGGSDLQRLTSFVAGRYAFAPAWSPDGSTIVFVAYGPVLSPVPNDVWTVRDDGTQLRRVFTGAFVDGAAYWAPDGRSLAFAASKVPEGDVGIYRVAMPDGPLLEVGDDRVWEETPTFAPDGRRLAFVVRHGGGFLLSDVWTLDLATGKRRNLTGTASGRTIDARSVRPPNRLTLARVAAWLDRSFARPRPILRVEVRVSDRTRDEVGGALVTVRIGLRGLEPLAQAGSVTDVHGDAQRAYRVLRPGAVGAGSRIRVTVSARPRAPHARRVAVSRELRLVVAARPPLG